MTVNGFIKPTLNDIIEEKKLAYITRYGTTFKFDDTNTIWQDSLIEAEREYQVWLQLDMIYSSRTLNGAEGTYLDDALGLQGVFRGVPKSGSGYAVINSSSSVLNTATLTTSSTFTNRNGVLYRPDTPSDFNNLSEGILMKASDFSTTPTTYSFTIVSDGVNQTTVATGVTNTNVTTLFSYISTLVATFSGNNIGTDIFIDDVGTLDETLRIGYSTDGLPIGITEPVPMYSSPEVGQKASAFFVISTQTGSYNTGVGDIVSVNPANSGYVSITNVKEFYSGSGTETDTQYRLKYQQEINRANASSYPAVFNKVSNVEGVNSVKIYDNPTLTPRTAPDVEAMAFKVLLNGGATADIAQAIADSKPINTRTDGAITYNVTTPDNQTEAIKFTRAAVSDIDILVSYTPSSGFPLTATEKLAITASIVEVGGTLDIGTTVYNAQVVAAVFSTIPFSFFTNLVVYIEGSVTNYVPPYDEIPNIVDTNITFAVI